VFRENVIAIVIFVVITFRENRDYDKDYDRDYDKDYDRDYDKTYVSQVLRGRKIRV